MNEIEKVNKKRELWNKGLSLQLVEEYDKFGNRYTKEANPEFEALDRGLISGCLLVSDVKGYIARRQERGFPDVFIQIENNRIKQLFNGERVEVF